MADFETTGRSSDPAERTGLQAMNAFGHATSRHLPRKLMLLRQLGQKTKALAGQSGKGKTKH